MVSRTSQNRVPNDPPTTMAELQDYLASFTNYEQMKRIPDAKRSLGPERAALLLDKLGLAPLPMPVIQVAGSKGKGSTVLWMEALLMLRGNLPGAYMSPHLERINERIRVGGEELSDDIIVGAMRELHGPLQEIERTDPDRLPTFFDVWTCLAMYLFARLQVSHVLLEVGLGGPLDSTSAIPHKVGVLTAVDLEHRQELGNTLDEIAREKARIARRDCPFVIADLGESWGQTAALQARAQGAEICAAPIDHRVPKKVEAPQDRNLAVAIAAIECLPGIEPYTSSEVEAVVDHVKLAGRLEELTGPPPLLLDSAHTQRSMAYFQRRFIAWRGARQGVVLIGFVDGKSWKECLEHFAQDGDSIDWVVTTPEPKRRLDPEPMAEYLRTFGGEVIIEEDITAAAEILRVRAKQGCALGATGSFYLSGRLRSLWR